MSGSCNCRSWCRSRNSATACRPSQAREMRCFSARAESSRYSCSGRLMVIRGFVAMVPLDELFHMRILQHGEQIASVCTNCQVLLLPLLLPCNRSFRSCRQVIGRFAVESRHSGGLMSPRDEEYRHLISLMSIIHSIFSLLGLNFLVYSYFILYIFGIILCISIFSHKDPENV